MARSLRAALAIGLVAISTLYAAAPAGIALVGIGYIPGSALDLSGLTGVICQASSPGNCIPRATLGGLGSDLTYTGHDNVYIAAPTGDRSTGSPTWSISTGCTSSTSPPTPSPSR